MDRGYSVRYQPPLFIVFFLIVLMSTVFLYSFYQSPQVTTTSVIHTKKPTVDAAANNQQESTTTKKDDRPTINEKHKPVQEATKPTIESSPTIEPTPPIESSPSIEPTPIKSEEKVPNIETKGSFKDGRTFEWLYSKSLKSPLYEKPFPKLEEDKEKMEAVKEAFLHAWNNYDQYCFGKDSYHPISKLCGSSNLNGGLTIIDSISTMIVMGLEEPYKKSLEFVRNNFQPSGGWSLFEFIIRYLGGLISAYSLSHDDVFKDAAVGLGEAIYPIMAKTGGFYSAQFRLSTNGHNEFTASGSGGGYCLAEVGTFQVEFAALTEMTGDQKFLDIALRVYQSLWNTHPNNGLISSHIGAGTDSYYEYIPKLFVQTGGTCPKLIRRHELLMRDIRDRLVFHTIHKNLTGIGTSGSSRPNPDIEHLATFAGGMCAVGSVKENRNHEDDLQLGRELAIACGETYKNFASGIMPEHVSYNIDNKNDPNEMRLSNDGYILRPETVETIFYLWRFTGDPIYREYNWQIFKAINRSCRVENGFTSIYGLDRKDPSHRDEMESFFLAETLKYLYLTFTDSSLISQAEWIFNTEAHPIHQWSEETINKYKDHLNDLLGRDSPSPEKLDDDKTLSSRTRRKITAIEKKFETNERLKIKRRTKPSKRTIRT